MGKLQQQIGNLNEADQLREHIASCETALTDVKTPLDAAEFLSSATEAHRLLDKLEADGTDIRSELGRLNSVGDRSKKQAKRIVKAAGGHDAYVALRAVNDPGSADPWWRLDEVLAAERRRRLIGLGVTVVVILSVIGLGYLFRDSLFPPNPVGDATTAASRALDKGDAAAALAHIESGLVITPANAELQLWRGALLETLNDPRFSAQYDAVKAKTTPFDFLLNRANVYLRFGKFDASIADLNEAIKLDPASPYTYFLRASSFESKRDIKQAMADLEEAARLAEAQKNDQLFAIARVRLGTMMQQNLAR